MSQPTAASILDDLQLMTQIGKSNQWKMKPQPKQKDGPVDFYKVVDADGRLVFTLGFAEGDHQTRILVEALLTKGHALVAGAALTVQMHDTCEEILACQQVKERDGITDAYNDRQKRVWDHMRMLMTQIRGPLDVVLGKKARKP
jgi:hypothetical protein